VSAWHKTNQYNILIIYFFSETGFLCVVLAVLELNSVDQAGLELRNLPASASLPLCPSAPLPLCPSASLPLCPSASASQVLGLKAWATTAQLCFLLALGKLFLRHSFKHYLTRSLSLYWWLFVLFTLSMRQKDAFLFTALLSKQIDRFVTFIKHILCKSHNFVIIS
jgi:hypothetical protein